MDCSLDHFPCDRDVFTKLTEKQEEPSKISGALSPLAREESKRLEEEGFPLRITLQH
jgi:hypothetical protein